MVTAPCDSPFVPNDLVSRLLQELNEHRADISVAHDGERMQPVFSLMHTALLPSLEEFLRSGGRKIDRWFAQHVTVTADFSDQSETFLNVNTPEEVRNLEARMQKDGRVAG